MHGNPKHFKFGINQESGDGKTWSGRCKDAKAIVPRHAIPAKTVGIGIECKRTPNTLNFVSIRTLGTARVGMAVAMAIVPCHAISAKIGNYN